jgi:hypothetical protein
VIGGKLLKRITIYSFLALFIVSSVFLTSVRAGNHYTGFQGGWNSSTFSEDANATIEGANNYTAGVIGVFSLTPWLAFQPEAMYSVRGASGIAEYGSYFGGTVEGSVELKYLEMPLLLRFMYPNSRDLVPHIVVGPAIAANLSAEATGMWGSRPVDGDISKVVTDGDLELVLGGGVDFGVSIVRISFDARYTYGLLSVDNSNRLPDLKNRVWTITAAVLFNVGEN